MKNFFFLVLLSFTVLFIQCEKDPCESINCRNGGTCIEGNCECPMGYSGNLCNERIFLLKKIIFQHNNQYQEYDYDNQNRVSKMTSYSGSFARLEYNYRYTEDDILVILIDNLDLDTAYFNYTQYSEDEFQFIVQPSYNSPRKYNYSSISGDCGFAYGESSISGKHFA